VGICCNRPAHWPLAWLPHLRRGHRLHLNGSLLGATRIQPPPEVYLWSAYNLTLLALVPYVVFRMRGYTREQLNLRSADWKNDTLVSLVVLAIGCLMDLTGPNIFQLTPHQRVVGGLLSFVIHLFLTDLPVMILIYAILLPRYARVFSPATAFLLGAASYPAIHIFETFTRYDSPYDSMISAIFVFFPRRHEVLSHDANRKRMGAYVGVSCRLASCHRRHSPDRA
jgi:hypothetical protein